MIYNDYRLNEEYIYNGEVLDIPITAMNGSRDADADSAIVDKWSKVTSAGFERYEFNGTHFFPYEDEEKNVIELIRKRILTSLDILKSK
jgi:surfactin synthase thioesterase subunit